MNRFRYSSNREYYFETDYLSQGNYSNFAPYRVSALQKDGTWKQIASVNQIRKELEKDAKLKK
ncbi:MAG: hypothetical protein AAGC68_11045, partial [Verrucomicrobiota bacterium]